MRRMLKAGRPSPAMVVAIVALVAALAGTGVAATLSRLDKPEKKQVKKIVNKQIKKKAGGLTVGTAGRAENVYAANVDSNGTLLGSVPDGITSFQTVQEGIYRVKFPRSVSGCLLFSASGSNDGSISSQSTGPTGVIPVPAEGPNLVGVATFNSPNGFIAPHDFYVQMTCP